MEEQIKKLQKELEQLVNIYGYDLVEEWLFELFFKEEENEEKR